MATRLLKAIGSPRTVALAFVAAILVAGSDRARAYHYRVSGATPITWGVNSPAGIWNDGTKTLTWHFNPISFPQPTWPTIAQAGAAFQNGYQTLQDIPGINLKIVRAADATNNPSINDGRLDMCFARDETNDPFGFSIVGAFAVTYVRSTGAFLTDADVVMNGDPNSFPIWATTGPPPPANSNDVELTACHEQIHTLGGGHPVYFYSMVWPTGRFPELMMFDRCLAPDDRVLVRTLYPTGTGLSTITGNVLVGGGGTCDRAVVVATDANGIPQATQVTNSGGVYNINVPAGAGYTVTVHHSMNSDYFSDINFAGATNFITSTTTGAVNASANVTAPDITVTAGVPTMTVTGIGQNGGAIGTQVLFAPKGSSGTMNVEITGQSFAAVTGNTASLGPGVTIGAVTAVPTGGGSVVNIPYTVTAGAVAGVRNMSFSIAGGERVFLPAYFEVLDTTSTLTVSASAGNPPAGAPPLGTPDVPLLGFTLTANAVEDVRIRRLVLNLAGTGATLPDVQLWIDRGTIGTLDAADVRVFTGDAYSSSPIGETIPATPPGTVTFDNLALTVPAGQAVNFLVVADMPASGSGSYTASLTGSAANIISHGMFYGNNITSTGTAAGNTQST
jgi:hypothetical protein